MMQTREGQVMLQRAAKTFLNVKTVVVAGVSKKGDVAANSIYKKFKETGYEVYPVNPNAKTVEGDRCYPSLKSIQKPIHLVVIATHPDVTPTIIRHCIEENIQYVWIHKSIGKGSFNEEAVNNARNAGIKLIPGSCPMMFLNPVDPAHKCMRWFFKISGKEVKPVGFEV